MLINNPALEQEWLVLHQDHESYERHALWLKLLLLSLWSAALVLEYASWPLFGIIAVFWLQEAIWRTGQARLLQRLLTLELALQQGYQPKERLYQGFEQQRGGVVRLLLEYLTNAIKPTVAWLYPLLLIATAVVAS